MYLGIGISIAIENYIEGMMCERDELNFKINISYQFWKIMQTWDQILKCIIIYKQYFNQNCKSLKNYNNIKLYAIQFSY